MLRWIIGGVFVAAVVAAPARAEGQPAPECMSPDGYPRGVSPDFDLAPAMPANAPAFPLFPADALPDGLRATDAEGAEVDAAFSIDDAGWILVEPRVDVSSELVVVGFEDACRAQLDAAASLEREFIVTEAAPLPDMMKGATVRESVIGSGCETRRALQVDVVLPEVFVPWHAALEITLDLRPTGDALDEPRYQGTTQVRPYLLFRAREPQVEDGALVVRFYVSPQCSAVELSSSLVPGIYEAEVTVELAGAQLGLEPLLTTLDMPSQACAPCDDPPEPEPEPEEDAEPEPSPEHDGAGAGAEEAQGCRVGGDPAWGLFVALLLPWRRRRRRVQSR